MYLKIPLIIPTTKSSKLIARNVPTATPIIRSMPYMFLWSFQIFRLNAIGSQIPLSILPSVTPPRNFIEFLFEPFWEILLKFLLSLHLLIHQNSIIFPLYWKNNSRNFRNEYCIFSMWKVSYMCRYRNHLELEWIP